MNSAMDSAPMTSPVTSSSMSATPGQCGPPTPPAGTTPSSSSPPGLASGGVGFDEGLCHLGHLVADLSGHALQQVLDLVGVEPVREVYLGVDEHVIGPEMHREQAKDVRDLREGVHGIVYALPVLGEHRLAQQERP